MSARYAWWSFFYFLLMTTCKPVIATLSTVKNRTATRWQQFIFSPSKMFRSNHSPTKLNYPKPKITCATRFAAKFHLKMTGHSTGFTVMVSDRILDDHCTVPLEFVWEFYWKIRRGTQFCSESRATGYF